MCVILQALSNRQGARTRQGRKEIPQNLAYLASLDALAMQTTCAWPGERSA